MQQELGSVCVDEWIENGFKAYLAVPTVVLYRIEDKAVKN